MRIRSLLAVERFHRHDRDLRLRLLIDFGAKCGELIAGRLAEHVGEVVDIALRRQLSGFCAFQAPLSRPDATKNARASKPQRQMRSIHVERTVVDIVGWREESNRMRRCQAYVAMTW